MSEVKAVQNDWVVSENQLGHLIIWLIIVGPALIDLLHGYLAIEFGITGLATLYRFAILTCGILALVARPRKSILVIILWYALFLIFELIAWSVSSQVYLFAELQSFANVVFLPLCYILLTFVVRYMGVTNEFIIRQVINYGKIAAFIVVVSLIFKIGIPTYSTQTGSIYGFGTQSYFVAGNVLGLTLVVSLAVSIYRFLKDCRLKYFLESSLIFAGAFSVGSRTGMGVSFLLVVFGAIYYIILSIDNGWRRAIVAIAFVPLIVYGAFKSYEIVTQYSRMNQKLEMLLAGEIRSDHTSSGWEYISTKGTATTLTGNSYQVYAKEFAQYSPKRNVQIATAESDPVDVIAAYGVVGLIVLYLPYVLCIAISAVNYLLTRYTAYLVAFFSLSLILGHSILAGHVLLNSKMTQFACVFILLALSSMRHSENQRTERSRS